MPATDQDLLQEACDRVRSGTALTSRMQMLLARAALQRVDEMREEKLALAREEKAAKEEAEKAEEARKLERKEKMKKKLKARKERKKEEKKHARIDTNLAGGLSAIGLENAEENTSRAARFRESAGVRVLEEALAGGREMQVVVGGGVNGEEGEDDDGEEDEENEEI